MNGCGVPFCLFLFPVSAVFGQMMMPGSTAVSNATQFERDAMEHARWQMRNAEEQLNQARMNEAAGITPENGWFSTTPRVMEAQQNFDMESMRYHSAESAYNMAVQQAEAAERRRIQDEEDDRRRRRAPWVDEAAKENMPIGCTIKFNNGKAAYTWHYQKTGRKTDGRKRRHVEENYAFPRGAGDAQLDPVPENGRCVCSDSYSRDSLLKIQSFLSDGALVRVLNFDCDTNVVCEVYVAPGGTVKLKVPSGQCAIGYVTGKLWWNFDCGFVNNELFVFPNAYAFTRKKGVFLKLKPAR